MDQKAFVSQMKVAIMQPYLFPYHLYWRLVQEVDVFVIFDNVNFRKKGFINRNYSYNDGTQKRFTLSLQKVSQNKLINEIDICSDQTRLKSFLRCQYNSCVNFNHVWPILDDILSFKDSNLASFLENSIKTICDYMEIRTRIISASSLQSDYTDLRGQDKILCLCKLLGANEYLNLPSGKLLYDKSTFKSNNLNLEFISPFSDKIMPGQVNSFHACSVIDLMMNIPQKSLINYFAV